MRAANTEASSIMKSILVLSFALLSIAGCTDSTSVPPAEVKPEFIGRLQLHVDFPKENGRYVERVGDKEFEIIDSASGRADIGGWSSLLIITDRRTGKTCKLDYKDQIAVIYASQDAKIVLFPHTSVDGRKMYVTILDTDSCKEKYSLGTSRLGYDVVGDIRIGGNRITVMPDCVCPKGGKCQCTAARVYALGEDDRPVLQEKESQKIMDDLKVSKPNAKDWVIRAAQDAQ